MANGNGHGNGPEREIGPIRRLRRWGRQSNHRRRRRTWGYRTRAAQPTRWITFLAAAGLLFLIGILLTGSTAYATYNYVAWHLPSANLGAYKPSQTVRIYDRNGKLLYEFWDEKVGRRTIGKIDQFSPYLVAATLAAEDPNFYENAGVDLKSVFRAVIQNTAEGEIVSGASTITMQLVRNVIFSPADRTEQSITRKSREALLAYQLTQKYSKDEILEMYLNEVYYGHLAYGVEAAAQTYFNKSAAELSLAEAALIAGLPQAPALYDPLEHPQAAKERQLYVLGSLAKHGFVTEDRAAAARDEPLNYQQPKNELLAPHFTLYVKDYVERTFGAQQMYEKGFNIYTTLDYGLLQIAEDEARKHLADLKVRNASDAALVTIDPKTGEVLNLMGSPDYRDSSIAGEVNMAVAQRQPGSTLKPFTYLTAFEQKKLTPATIIIDQATQFPGGRGQPPYEPLNHDKRWHGPVTVRRALSGSLNMPAVLTLHWVGLENMLDTIHRMGIRSLKYDPDKIGLAVTLGGGEVNLLELAFAYTPFANAGRLTGQLMPDKERQSGFTDLQPAVIRKITDSAGKTLFEYQPPTGPQVTRPEYAYQITNILTDDNARQATYGLNSPLVLNRPAAAKTGTTENYNDGWTIGYTPQLVTGVWVGNANNDPMTDVFGSSGAGVIWHNYMERAHEYLHLPKEEFTRPGNLVDLQVMEADPVNAQYQVATDLFVPGTEPPGARPAPSPTVTGTVTRASRQPAPACVPGWVVKVNGSPAKAREIDKLYRPEPFNQCGAAPTPTQFTNPSLNETPISEATPVSGTLNTLPELLRPLPTVGGAAPPLGPDGRPLPTATPQPGGPNGPAGTFGNPTPGNEALTPAPAGPNSAPAATVSPENPAPLPTRANPAPVTTFVIGGNQAPAPTARPAAPPPTVAPAGVPTLPARPAPTLPAAPRR